MARPPLANASPNARSGKNTARQPARVVAGIRKRLPIRRTRLPPDLAKSADLDQLTLAGLLHTNIIKSSCDDAHSSGSDKENDMCLDSDGSTTEEWPEWKDDDNDEDYEEAEDRAHATAEEDDDEDGSDLEEYEEAEDSAPSTAEEDDDDDDALDDETEGGSGDTIDAMAGEEDDDDVDDDGEEADRAQAIAGEDYDEDAVQGDDETVTKVPFALGGSERSDSKVVKTRPIPLREDRLRLKRLKANWKKSLNALDFGQPENTDSGDTTAARETLLRIFEEIINAMKEIVPDRRYAATPAFRNFFRKVDASWFAELLVQHVPATVIERLGKDDITFEDIEAIPQCSVEDMVSSGCYAMGTYEQGSDHCREAQMMYTGSSINYDLGMLSRVTIYNSTVRDRRVRENLLVSQTLAKKGTSAFWRRLAVFPPSVHAGYVRIMESIWMIHLGTVDRPGVYRHWAPKEAADACDEVRERRPGRPWGRLNRIWSIAQGAPKGYGVQKFCHFCKRTRSTMWYCHEGRAWSSWLCRICGGHWAKYRKPHPNPFPKKLPDGQRVKMLKEEKAAKALAKAVPVYCSGDGCGKLVNSEKKFGDPRDSSKTMCWPCRQRLDKKIKREGGKFVYTATGLHRKRAREARMANPRPAEDPTLVCPRCSKHPFKDKADKSRIGLWSFATKTLQWVCHSCYKADVLARKRTRRNAECKERYDRWAATAGRTKA